jgi:hypothetical protein
VEFLQEIGPYNGNTSELSSYTSMLTIYTQLPTNQLTLQTVKHRCLYSELYNPATNEANAPEDGEFFDFNVSGSKSDGPIQPACQPCRQAQDATEVDQQINYLTPVQNSKKAGDTHHFE